MKPDWKDAPEWANYRGMDPDGKWWWFAKMPRNINKHGWLNEWDSLVQSGGTADPSDDWFDTLEGRP